MKISLSQKAEKTFAHPPQNIKKKAMKQFAFLDTDSHHPSLRVKRLQGTLFFEARIDYHYRFVFQLKGDTLYIVSLGPHDKGLGK